MFGGTVQFQMASMETDKCEEFLLTLCNKSRQSGVNMMRSHHAGQRVFMYDVPSFTSSLNG